MKDKLFILTAILSIGCLVIAIRANQIVKENQGVIDQERYQRLIAEEALQNANVKVNSLENKVISTRNQVQGIQALLEREKIASEGMQREIEKLNKLNDVLERELKNALVREPEEAVPFQP